jgi:hypothetical protein
MRFFAARKDPREELEFAVSSLPVLARARVRTASTLRGNRAGTRARSSGTYALLVFGLRAFR